MCFSNGISFSVKWSLGTVPIESVSAIMNSRLNVYPFILSKEILSDTGDGSKVPAHLEDVEDGSRADLAAAAREAGGYEEPDDFVGYLKAMQDGT